MPRNSSDPKSNQQTIIMERLAVIEKRVRNNKIPFSHGGGIDFILEEDILYVQANGNYCYLYMRDGSKTLISLSIKKVEELLEDFSFFRIHDSFLINLKHIKRYSRGDGGVVVLINGERLPVSRGKKPTFLNRIKEDFSGTFD